MSKDSALTVSQTLAAWTELWNGDLGIARQICADDFTIFFGREVLAVMRDAQRDTALRILPGMRSITAEPLAGLRFNLLPPAIAARRVVRLGYCDDDATRSVEPMALLRGGNTWYLVGWCRTRDAIRGFRLDRIRDLEITDEVAPVRDPSLLEADLGRWQHRRLDS